MSDVPDAGYAFWSHPEGLFRVEYSLAVFHDIDFSVGEAFRSIPHGGMETGGLLFGTNGESTARIEAFRPIECEHAFGPSFILSDRDLRVLGDQLAGFKNDPDLSGLAALGWFVAHTRSDLAVNERELQWFNGLFPEAGRFMVLVKPERFQPTRFSFLIRSKDGQLERDGRNRAIILPLPGRATGSANGPVPSMPAPRIAPPPPPAPRGVPERPPARTPETPAETAPTPPPKPIGIPRRVPEPMPEPQFSIPQRIATIPEVEERQALAADTLALGRYTPRRRVEEPRQIGSSIRLLIVLLIAAALGSAAGYWAYLQLPSPTISLSATPRGSELVISWPPEQTRGVSYAVIRIDDGAPVPLSAADKASGQTTIKYSGNDVKVELVVQHWMRQSRGIVRFVTAGGP